jgi:hypothetical protein
MAKSFIEKLIEVLKTDSRFVDDEGELVKAAVIDRAWKIDRDLVKLLLSESDIKETMPIRFPPKTAERRSRHSCHTPGCSHAPLYNPA